ncbi:MAG TPA: Maf family protein [Xanthobacteraceae bacterium]|nr:Maf family protein [Xanthobacteraceae bacterium]
MTALWLAEKPLVLASRSEVRRALLEGAGLALETCPADLDERRLEADAVSQAPGAIAAHLAREKARAVAKLRAGRLTLGADQTLALGGARFSKPVDLAAARSQLCALSGKTHELHSAIAFVRDDKILCEYVGVARLTMRSFSDQFLDLYLKSAGNTATSSVGAYQLESFGIQLFERIEGDYFTILGLPLLQALEFLRQQGCLAQ